MGNSKPKPSNVQIDESKRAKEEEKAAIEKERKRVMMYYCDINNINTTS